MGKTPGAHRRERSPSPGSRSRDLSQIIGLRIDKHRYMRYALGMKTSLPSRSLPVRGEDAAEGACCGGPTATPSLDQPQTIDLADLLKALADPTRLRLLDLLVEQSAPLCVCDLTPRFEQHQPTISHHLRILRQAGLIVGEKRGTWSYYAATERGRHCVSVIRTLL